MTNVLLIVFIISLVYLGIANRLLTFITIIAFQSFILFWVTLLELHDMSTGNLVFILIETIVFKTVAVPAFLVHLIKKNKMTRDAEPFLHNFTSLMSITCIIVATIVLSYYISDTFIKKIYFVVALSTLFIGLFIIATRSKIITHVMGYLIIENGVFVLSIAVGNEMPMLLNMGIMLDIFASVLILGIFLNKIGNVIKDADVHQLRHLKD